MVTRTFDFIRVMCVQYWPAAKNREEIYGGVGITVESEEQLANFMIRNPQNYLTIDNTIQIKSNTLSFLFWLVLIYIIFILGASQAW